MKMNEVFWETDIMEEAEVLSQAFERDSRRYNRPFFDEEEE